MTDKEYFILKSVECTRRETALLFSKRNVRSPKNYNTVDENRMDLTDLTKGLSVLS